MRYQKRAKIAPGVRANIGKKGLNSVSFGKRGASLNVGKHGVRANVGIPGTGIRFSTQLIGGKKKAKKRPHVQPAQNITKNNNEDTQLTEGESKAFSIIIFASLVLLVTLWIITEFMIGLFVAIFVFSVSFVILLFRTSKSITDRTKIDEEYKREVDREIARALGQKPQQRTKESKSKQEQEKRKM